MTLADDAYRLAYEHAFGHCEAMVLIPDSVVWTRCGSRQVEVHHRITRARGGTHLDDVGEHRHLMLLCRRHHAVAHDESRAFERGLLISGYVTLVGGEPVYVGPHDELRKSYGKRSA